MKTFLIQLYNDILTWIFPKSRPIIAPIPFRYLPPETTNYPGWVYRNL